MGKDLVVVESPAKARTVARYLGNKYVVKASMGHVRDLPQGSMGVEVDDGFKPQYEVLPDKRKVIKELKEASKEASAIYLATDPDREGEAISWHLVQAVALKRGIVRRVVFHEITQDAIDEAFRHPREIDMRLVNAQQARRILDRLVGYRLSPLLWGKVRRGLSAGRVQSVALRLVVDREQEIQVFVPQEYWSIEAELAKDSDGKSKASTFKASLHSLKGQRKRLAIENQQQAEAITKDLEGAGYTVLSVVKKEAHSRPSPPFITSTLQQEASRKLRFSSRKTMQIAQHLYEGLPLGKEGSVGLITYMRTDSTHVAPSALSEARDYIRLKFGPEFAPKSPRVFTRKVRGAQEAHEAIRPTSIRREPQGIRGFLNLDQFRLYDLIWKRMLASQMADAISDATNIDIQGLSQRSNTRYLFKASGSVLKFLGFRTLYVEGRDEPQEREDGELPLPELSKDEALDCLELDSKQHFTQPPPRYTEATLIKALEEKGIGRPSTYAPIISTIKDRSYVSKEQGRFLPQKLGTAVSGLLTAHFSKVIDPGFTAQMEKELDDIARGEQEWVPMLKEFYGPFDKAVKKAMEKAQRVPRSEIDEETDEICEQCGRPMVIKTGRFGRFLSCSGFPECRNSRRLLAKTGVECPRCGGDLVERRQKGKGGKRFFGCSNYPKCDLAVNQRPLPQPCPDCSQLLVAFGRGGARCTSCAYKGAIPQEEPLEVAV